MSKPTERTTDEWAYHARTSDELIHILRKRDTKITAQQAEIDRLKREAMIQQVKVVRLEAKIERMQAVKDIIATQSEQDQASEIDR